MDGSGGNVVKGTSPLNCHNLELTAARSDFTDPLLTCVCCGHTRVVAARIVYTLTSVLALRGPLHAWRGSSGVSVLSQMASLAGAAPLPGPWFSHCPQKRRLGGVSRRRDLRGELQGREGCGSSSPLPGPSRAPAPLACGGRRLTLFSRWQVKGG